jgi:hypothetical protein
MDINQILNPPDEVMEDTGGLEQLDELILAQFGPELEIEAETDEEVEESPKISTAEALEALEKLVLYEEQQDEDKKGFLEALQRHRQVVLLRRGQNQQQKDIRAVFC